MAVQPLEIDWLERVEGWAEQSAAIADSVATRINQADSEGETVDWAGRFWEIRDWADALHQRLLADASADILADMAELDAKARELDAAVRPLIENNTENDAAEMFKDIKEAEKAETHTTEADRFENDEREAAQNLGCSGRENADGRTFVQNTYEPEEKESNGETAVASSSSEFYERNGIEEDRKSHQTHVVAIGQHKLPPLPYAYNALEPHISADIMRLHHQIHHQGYVDSLNEAELAMQTARWEGQFDLIRHWQDEAAFHGAGHYMHTLFWHSMSPDGGGEPSGAIAQEIKQTFGSFAQFKEHFTHAADKVQGPGWAMLVWSPRSRRTEIMQAEKHQNSSQQDVIPLLVLDVWEHAYYLQYHANRRNYIDAWWHVVCWDNVNERFEKARKLMWQPS